MKKIFQSKIFHNFSWLLADKLIRLILSLFVSVVVARYLGPEQYGLWNYFISFVMFFTAFASLGFENIIPRELINQNDKEQQIISTAFVFKLIGSIIGFVLSILIFILYKDPDKELLIMMSLMASLLIFQSADIIDIYFKTKLKAKHTVLGRNVAFVIVALLKLYFVWGDYPLIYFVASNALEFLLGGTLVYFTFLQQKNKFSLSDVEWKLGIQLLNDGWPMAISAFLVMLYMRIDQVMLTDIAGEKANGIYSTGVRMVEIIYFIPMALADSFYPGIIYSKKHEGNKYEGNLRAFYSIMFYIALFICIVTWFVAEPLMSFLFGLEYEGSGLVLKVLGLSLIATFLSIASGKYLSNENFTRIILLRSVAGLGINVILNLIWIPEFGYMGAAYASVISYTIPVLILLFFRKSRHQINLIIQSLNPFVLIKKISSRSSNL